MRPVKKKKAAKSSPSPERFVACVGCGSAIRAHWEKCPGCGTVQSAKKRSFYFPIDKKQRKEYMICANCGLPIKEEESYKDKKFKVMLHLSCHPQWMKKVSEGEVE